LLALSISTVVRRRVDEALSLLCPRTYRMADFVSNCLLFLILMLAGSAWLLAGWCEQALSTE
jgi:hypothetical protein